VAGSSFIPSPAAYCVSPSAPPPDAVEFIVTFPVPLDGDILILVPAIILVTPVLDIFVTPDVVVAAMPVPAVIAVIPATGVPPPPPPVISNVIPEPWFVTVTPSPVTFIEVMFSDRREPLS
jgi:hypothetical protein